MSIDPVDFMQTGDPRFFNRYAYAYNDPTNAIDPDGRFGYYPGAAQDQAAQANSAPVKALRALAPGVGVVAAVNSGAGALGIAGAVVMEAPIAKPLKAIKGAAGGARAGKKHTRAAVRDEIAANAKINGGTVKCVTCKTDTTPATRRTAGSTVAPTEAQGAHIKANGGDGATVKDRSNVAIQCASCNNKTRTNDVEFN